ncbi:MAG TPA: TonB-dependent receptor [Thermoanaerobaculia bacterium]
MSNSHAFVDLLRREGVVMKQLSSFFPLFLLTLAIPATAQPANPNTSSAMSAEIVVTASSLPEEVEETPATATVITREEIERREVRDVIDVLREVPGLTGPRTGSPGKTATLFIRGGSSKQALILWNGVEVNYPYYSAYNFGQVSTAGVEKIEVVRGPFSALYGSEAMSGVVNVLTNRTSPGGTLLIEGGERGLFDALASGAATFGSVNVHGAAERRVDEGFAANDDFESTSFTGGATLTGARYSIGLLARRSEYDLGIPRVPNAAGTAFIPSPQRRENAQETLLALPVHFDAAGWAFDLRVANIEHDEEFADPLGTFGPEQSVTDSRNRSARATASSATRIGTLSFGAEVEDAVANHVDAFSAVDARERDSRSFFIEDRVSIAAGANASIELAAGLRHDEFNSFGSELSPRVAAAWVRSGHKVRAAYGEGFRAPGIAELYTPVYGNPELEAEQSRTVEIGYERYLTNGNFAVTLFRSDFEDLIFFASDFRYRNIAAASSQGVEFAARRTFGKLSTSASYTWLDTEDEATGQQLVRRPEHSGSFALGYDFAPFSAHLVVAHTGERLDVTDLLPYGNVTNEAFTTADLTLHYQRGPLTPFVKIENVTNEQYEAVFGYPSGGRRIRAGVRFTMGR